MLDLKSRENFIPGVSGVGDADKVIVDFVTTKPTPVERGKDLDYDVIVAVVILERSKPLMNGVKRLRQLQTDIRNLVGVCLVINKRNFGFLDKV